ncbi:MAG: hypothetical protein VKJ46_16060 [Leptolyngbyaceae bacterium]|nr:hypothetical protein [Leptolyngbyaceae bacterium]
MVVASAIAPPIQRKSPPDFCKALPTACPDPETQTPPWFQGECPDLISDRLSLSRHLSLTYG